MYCGFTKCPLPLASCSLLFRGVFADGWNLTSLLTRQFECYRVQGWGPLDLGLGVPWQGCFQSWLCEEGKLAVITEQMPLMRSLLDFQLASRALHWDRNTEVTG